MTKHRIRQYTSLLREIDMLETQIATAGQGDDLVADYAKDYTTGRPRVITLKGYGTQDVLRLIASKAKRQDEVAAIEGFIEGVDDSVMRQLLTRWGIEGRSMEETGALVGYSRKQASKLINRFFEKRLHKVTQGP